MNDNDVQHREVDVADLLDAVQAKEIAPGVTLMTKDGRTIGNAIVIRETTAPAAMEYLQSTGQKLWLIETDFGNRVSLCDNEIHDMFNLGYPRNYDSWWDARMEKIQEGVNQGEPG